MNSGWVRSKDILGGGKVMNIEGNNIEAEVYIPSRKLYPPKVCFLF